MENSALFLLAFVFFGLIAIWVVYLYKVGEDMKAIKESLTRKLTHDTSAMDEVLAKVEGQTSQIVDEVKQMAMGAKQRIDDEAQKVIQVERETYGGLAATVKEVATTEVSDFTAQMRVEMETKINEIAANLALELRQTYEGHVNELAATRKGSEELINKHTQEAIEKLDMLTQETIKRLALDILGKSIPLDMQEELIVKSLERAKKEYVQ